MRFDSQFLTTYHGLFITLLVLLLLASPVSAEIKIELDAAEITGAKELPKVLYIVPWKKSEPDPRPLPMRSLMDDILSPIDIDVFRRQVRYHEMTQTSPESDSPTPQ